MSGPSSSCVPWSNTPPDMNPALPTSARVIVAFDVQQHSRHPEKKVDFGAAIPQPARSPAYASPMPFLESAQG